MIDHIAVTSLFTTQHILLIKFQNLHFVTPSAQTFLSAQTPNLRIF